MVCSCYERVAASIAGVRKVVDEGGWDLRDGIESAGLLRLRECQGSLIICGERVRRSYDETKGFRKSAASDCSGRESVNHLKNWVQVI